MSTNSFYRSKERTGTETKLTLVFFASLNPRVKPPFISINVIPGWQDIAAYGHQEIRVDITLMNLQQCEIMYNELEHGRVRSPCIFPKLVQLRKREKTSDLP